MKVIKIGGNAISQVHQSFFDTLKSWTTNGERVLIVHGGGPLINKVTEFFGLKNQKINGIRVTDSSTLQLTQATLVNVIQPYFLKILSDADLKVKSLNQNGQIPLIANYFDESTYGLVGTVVDWKKSAFDSIQPGEIALLTSLGCSETGQILNINADQVAESTAILAHSKELILLTDVPGILVQGQLLEKITVSQLKQLIKDGEIKNGMIAKAEAAIHALTKGVLVVRITDQLDHSGTIITIKGAIK